MIRFFLVRSTYNPSDRYLSSPRGGSSGSIARRLGRPRWNRPHEAQKEELSCPFYQKSDVRIRYEETGSGFPLLVIPGGGLNSRISNWSTAVINAMEAFKNDFRCITMDQRYANGGKSTGPVPVDNPWDAFADDQLGLNWEPDFLKRWKYCSIVSGDASGRPTCTRFSPIS